MKIKIPVLKISVFVSDGVLQLIHLNKKLNRKWLFIYILPFSFSYFSGRRYDLEWNTFKKLRFRVWDNKEKRWLRETIEEK